MTIKKILRQKVPSAERETFHSFSTTILLCFGLLAMITPSLGFSLVGRRSEFRLSGTDSTYDLAKPNRAQVRSFTRVHYQSEGGSTQGALSKNEKPLVVDKLSQTSLASLWRKPCLEDEQQAEQVDQYLEFLGKRYNRLHSIDQTPQTSRHFPVLNWLFHEESHSEKETFQNNRSNALYALGVAGLASERLLQKHGVVLKKCSIVQASNDDTITVQHSSSHRMLPRIRALLNKILAAVTAQWMRLHDRLTTQSQLLQQAASQKTRRLSASVRRTTSHLARAAWKAGGGKHSLKFAATAFSAVMIFAAQPLLKIALSTGAHTQV